MTHEKRYLEKKKKKKKIGGKNRRKKGVKNRTKKREATGFKAQTCLQTSRFNHLAKVFQAFL